MVVLRGVVGVEVVVVDVVVVITNIMVVVGFLS